MEAVWDPRLNGLNGELENVQKPAARFVSRNYSRETGSMTGILEELKWETRQKMRKDNRLILLYKCLIGKARIPIDLIHKNRRCRIQHSMAFQNPDVHFPKLSGTGMTSLIHSSPLLNCRMTAYLN